MKFCDERLGTSQRNSSSGFRLDKTHLDLLPTFLFVYFETTQAVRERYDATVTWNELLRLHQTQIGASSECDCWCWRWTSIVGRTQSASAQENVKNQLDTGDPGKGREIEQSGNSRIKSLLRSSVICKYEGYVVSPRLTRVMDKLGLPLIANCLFILSLFIFLLANLSAFSS